MRYEESTLVRKQKVSFTTGICVVFYVEFILIALSRIALIKIQLLIIIIFIFIGYRSIIGFIFVFVFVDVFSFEIKRFTTNLSIYV